MKLMSVVAVLMLVVSSAFAHNHEKTVKSVGHDKEHAHVKKDKADHEHNDNHHEKHDHKKHHPDHKDAHHKKHDH